MRKTRDKRDEIRRDLCSNGIDPAANRLETHVAHAAGRRCRDVAADLITLLVPVKAEPMATAIAHSQVAANPLRPRAVNRETLAINTVARRTADWMDDARFVLLGFLYEGRGRTG